MSDSNDKLNMRDFLSNIPFHPILIAAAPALIMLASNIDQLKSSTAFRAIAFSIVAGFILLVVLRVVLRSWKRAALITSVLILFFFTYGQAYGFLRSQEEWGTVVARHRNMLPIWLIGFGVVIYLLLRTRQSLGPLTSLFNLFAIAAVIVPLVQIAAFEVRTTAAASRFEPDAAQKTSLQLPERQRAPDIYYIVPDAYARDDVLLSEYGYDNQPFLDSLEQMGFYVARCSQSNYVSTDLSLPASLNLNYLEALGDEFQPGRSEKHGLVPLIKKSRVRRELEGLGYSVVAFETGYVYTQWEDADYYYALPKPGSLGQFVGLEGVNGFEAMLIRNSGARILTDIGNVTDALYKILPDLDRPRSIYHDRTLFVLDKLAPEGVPSLRGPKLVFVHLITPHYPFVFERDGAFVDREISPDDREAYINQLVYLNVRLVEILAGIIKTSDVPPIVILQADHGNVFVRSAPTEILNAYFLPDNGYDALYPSISPVNSFRLIFDTYFSGNFGLLEDASYSSTHELPYDVTEVPDSRPGCESE